VAPVVRVGSWPLNAFRQRESAQPVDKRTSAAGFTVDGLWSVAGEGPSAQNGPGAPRRDRRLRDVDRFRRRTSASAAFSAIGGVRATLVAAGLLSCHRSGHDVSVRALLAAVRCEKGISGAT